MLRDSFDTFGADSGRTFGASDIQKPCAEADDLCALVGRAFETLLPGTLVSLPVLPAANAAVLWRRAQSGPRRLHR